MEWSTQANLLKQVLATAINVDIFQVDTLRKHLRKCSNRPIKTMEGNYTNMHCPDFETIMIEGDFALHADAIHDDATITDLPILGDFNGVPKQP